MRLVGTVSTLLALLSAGCATTSDFDRYFEEGRYFEAVASFEADPAMHASERGLFRAALIHARPGEEAYDPDRALQLLEHLAEVHPGSSHHREAAVMLRLLEKLRAFEESAIRREAETIREVAALEGTIDRLEDQVGWLHTFLERQDQEREVLYEVVARLEGDLRHRERQAEELREELERLKAIDLRNLDGGAAEVVPAPDTATAGGATTPPDA